MTRPKGGFNISDMKDITAELTANKAAGKSAEQILAEVSDGEFYYALSPERANILEWYPFQKTDEVLQLGKFYEVFAPLYGRVKSWTVAGRGACGAGSASGVSEETGDRSRRTANCEEIDGRIFDVVIDTAGSFRLRDVKKYLKPDGVLIVLCENENAPRFVMGGTREPGKTYVSESDLEDLKKDFAWSKMYYPLPGLDFARDIRDEKHAPGPGKFRFVAKDVLSTRYSLCDEETVYDELSAKDPENIRKYAPAYICLYADRAPETELPGFIRYNSGRRPEYAIRTELFEEKAVKTALSTAANAHIDGFLQRKETAGGSIPMLSAELSTDAFGRSSASFELLKGENLGTELSRAIRDGRAPEKEMKTWLDRFAKEAGNRNLDLIFDNVFLTKNGPVVIDYEWMAGEPLESAYAKYRPLRCFYDEYEKILTAYRDIKDFMSRFGISEKECDAFGEKEDAFQQSVADPVWEKLAAKFIKPVVVPMKDENERLRDEVDELRTILKKERETERLSQQHIRNIEAINKAREAEISARDAELSYLRRHQTLFSRWKRAFIVRLDAWAPADSKKRMAIRYIKGVITRPGTYLPRLFGKSGKILRKGDFAIGGEFPEGGILELPQTDAPKVSIVIPAYNQAAYTYACIRSILGNTDFAETPYEVILADDASTDVTCEIENFIHGLVHAKTAGNLGFLRNCNQAAAKARGEYIFFLNNDTKVKPGWLSSLVTLMDGDDSIGMAGSRLVFADGKLQEAGGIIWSDASGWNYGRGDDPAEPEYNYVKDVDYISGAAICIRRSLWQGIGGFDERFAPAYCEDSDLAFEVRKHGKRVVYQPLSEVVHFEGVSNGTDVNGTGLKRYQVVNQEKFREKWKDELACQQENTGDPDPFTARDRSGNKKCILIVDHYVPTWDKDAGSVTTYQYIRMFVKQGWNVKFLGDNFLHEEPYTTVLTQMGVEVLYGERLKSGIWDWIAKNKSHIDVAYLNRPHIAAKYIDTLKDCGIRCIFYGHDLHYLRIRREYELTGEIRKKRESDYWKSLEYEVMEKADKVYYPSADEVAEISRMRPDLAGKTKAIIAFLYENETAAEISAEAAAKKRSGFLFLGGFKHPPNADGVLWFAENCWDAIRSACPGAEFFVAGSSPTEEILALPASHPGISVLGFITDEKRDELYRSVKVVAVPLRYGAGVKGKVTEALAEGSAVVTTPVGAEGIPEAEKAMVICKEADEFTEACIRLYQDETAQETMRNAGRALIREHFSPEAAWKVIEKDFR